MRDELPCFVEIVVLLVVELPLLLLVEEERVVVVPLLVERPCERLMLRVVGVVVVFVVVRDVVDDIEREFPLLAERLIAVRDVLAVRVLDIPLPLLDSLVFSISLLFVMFE